MNPAETSTTLTSGANPVLEGSPVRLNAAVSILPPGQGKLSGKVQFQIDGQNLGDPVTLAEGAVASLETDDLAPGVYALSAVYLGDGNFRQSASAALSLTVLSGDLSLDVTPEEGGEIVYPGEHNGQPVETRISTPAGAVDRKLTLVFHQFYDTTLTPPSGKDFVILFTLEAYVDGVKQEPFEFLKPLTVTMGYNPETWDENSLDLAGWDGSRWNAGGITLLSRAPEADTIAFTLAGVGPDPFALVGTHAYPVWLPVMLSGGQ